jgi:hypothetical protein
VTLSPVWPAYSANLVVSNHGSFARDRTFPVDASIAWRLDSSRSERLPKTVYLRFDRSSQTFSDEIMLDETAPTVGGATLVGFERDTGARTSGVRKRRDWIRLRARDNASGVVGCQVTTQRRKPGRLRRFSKRQLRLRRTIGVRPHTGRLYVRVRDAAGNNSKWRAVRDSPGLPTR